MLMINLFYSWGMIDADCNMLATMATRYAEKTARIVALDNDLVPATLMAARLNLPIIQITDINNPPSISEPFVSGDGTMSDAPNLIFVVSRVTEEVAGEINYLTQKYEIFGHDIFIIALFAGQTDLIKQINYQTFLSPDVNVTFPWTL